MFSLGPGNDLARGDASTPEGSGLWTAQRRRPKASPGPPPPSSAAPLPHHKPSNANRSPPGGLWKPSTLRKDRQEANIHRDVGVSGGTGTNSRADWRALNARLVSGDILVVVAIDRIGRRWMDTVNAVRDLRAREVRIRSLAQSEATWVTYLAAEPDTAEAVIGDILTTFMAWAAEQELQAVSRRTRAGLERARAEGKTLGPPPRVDDGQVEAMARLRREGQSFRSIGRVFGVSRTTVQRRVREVQNQGETGV